MAAASAAVAAPPIGLSSSSSGTPSSPWRAKKLRVFQSVFQTQIAQPTPYSTPSLRFPSLGQAFGGPPPPPAPAVAAAAVTATLNAATSSLAAAQLRQGSGAAASSAARDGTSLYAAESLRGPPSRLGAEPGLLSPSAGGPPGYHLSRGAADDQIQYDRAWHTVTARISLPSSVAAEDSFGTLAPESQLQSQDVATESDFQAALDLVLNAKSALPRATHTDDILAWHTQQVRRHFVQHVLPMVAACADGIENTDEPAGPENTRRYYEKHMEVVLSGIRTLEAALRLYFYGLSLLVRGMRDREDDQGLRGKQGDDVSMTPEAVISRFRRDVHALVGNSAAPGLMAAIRVVLLRLVSIVLGMQKQPARAAAGSKGKSKLTAGRPGDPPEEASRPLPPGDDNPQASAARQRLHELVEALFKVGLAGERFQILLAEIMNQIMSDFVEQSYAGVWAAADGAGDAWKKLNPRLDAPTQPPCIASLYDWTENHFARLSLEILSRISTGKHADVSLSDVKEWKEVALGRLAALRISELFDIVLGWPASRGGLDDLRASLATPQRRSQLVAAFSAAVQKRLLHPARSTLEILRVYIAMIRTFHALDQSNVLLGGAVGSLQLYLCRRDDAVRIVVTGLLASPDEVKEVMSSSDPSRRQSSSRSSHPAKLVELAVLLNDPSQQRRQYIDDEDLDWDDMSWVPDPIDAGANYKRPKSEDVIGTIISALGSQDVFIKEFQNIVAERLLSAQTDFSQEMRVLKLLKKRFGEAALQNCDVMIKDVYDSRRVDAAIRRAQQQQQQQRQRRPLAAAPLPPATPIGGAAAAAAVRDVPPSGGDDDDLRYQARILSRLFWPNLAKDTFLLPNPVADLQRRYESGYEHLKSSRKLTWLNQLGQATVELELRDRTVAFDCATYEAAVIYAFQDPRAPDADVRLSADDVAAMLRMDDDLVRLALGAWVRRGVLRHVGGGSYAVVETQGEQGGRGGGGGGDGAAGPASGSAAGDDGSTVTSATGANTVAAALRDNGGVGGGAGKDDKQRGVYWQFIVGMLTNSAASMPLPQIAMMMKMLIADGFPWTNEELQEFLAEKVADGELEVAAGKYRLVKK